MRGKKLLSALTIAIAIQAGAAHAEYPDQRINVIVPFVAGGATDIIARTIAADLASRFGQPVTIENRAGGGTAVGTEAVVRSPPDGYTILFNSGALTIDAGFKKNLTYDVRKDLLPVTKAAWGPYAVLVYKELPVKTLSELIGYAKEKPSDTEHGLSRCRHDGALGQCLSDGKNRHQADPCSISWIGARAYRSYGRPRPGSPRSTIHRYAGDRVG